MRTSPALYKWWKIPVGKEVDTKQYEQKFKTAYDTWIDLMTKAWHTPVRYSVRIVPFYQVIVTTDVKGSQARDDLFIIDPENSEKDATPEKMAKAVARSMYWHQFDTNVRVQPSTYMPTMADRARIPDVMLNAYDWLKKDIFFDRFGRKNLDKEPDVLEEKLWPSLTKRIRKRLLRGETYDRV